jgi:uncharacterized protein YkwD
MKKRSKILAALLVFSMGVSCIFSQSSNAEETTAPETSSTTEQQDTTAQETTTSQEATTDTSAGETTTEAAAETSTSTEEATEASTSEETTTGSTEETTVTDTTTDLFEQNGTMKFLALINKQRLKNNLSPLVVIESMQEAAQARAEELEISCSETRPDSKGYWYTIFSEFNIVHDLSKITDSKKRIYSVSEFRASGAKTSTAMYKEWMSNSKTKASLLKSGLTHIGLGHTTGSVTINGKKDTNPWVLLMIGKYTPDALTIKDADQTLTVPKGLSLDDAGIILELRSISPEGYPVTGELPLLSAMCSGYDSSKTGTQKVTVTYKYSSTVSLKTSFNINVKKATPKVPDIFNATGTSYNTVTVKWSPVEKATSYKIYRSTSKKSGYKAVKTLKVSDLTLTKDGTYTYKDSGLTSGKLYYYKIKAFAGSTGSEYSSWDDAKPNVDAPSSVKVSKKSSTSLKVSWKKVSHATSYRVYYATSKNGHYKRAGITTKTSFTIKKLSKKKTYYIKVLSYRNKLPGKYSQTITKKLS